MRSCGAVVIRRFAIVIVVVVVAVVAVVVTAIKITRRCC